MVKSGVDCQTVASVSTSPGKSWNFTTSPGAHSNIIKFSLKTTVCGVYFWI